MSGIPNQGGGLEFPVLGGVVSSRGPLASRATVRVDLKELFNRPPPASAEAEMSLLGALLIDPRAIGDIVIMIPTGGWFYDQRHGVIYDAMVQLSARHQGGDLVQLAEILRDKHVLDDVGGIDYLYKLASETISAAHAKYYAKIVREKHQLRELITAAGLTVHEAYHATDLGDDGAREVLDRAEGRIFKIAEHSIGMDIARLPALLQAELDRMMADEGKAITGVSTGFHDLDELTSGLQRGEMVVVAARPSMGKTALALNLAEQIAFGGSPHDDKGPHTPVAVFSMEMSRQQLVQRLICARSGVDSHKMRRNMLNQDEVGRVMQACGELNDAPIFIDDTPGLSVMALRAKARRLAAQFDIRCIVIDYLQLMSAPQAAKENRQQEVSAISRGVKALARELNLPVVCLAQLNRAAETREGHRPRMGDLRESGSIEQDADTIMLLHREDYYHVGDEEWLGENQDKVGVAELIIAKQRNGPTDTVKLSWDRTTTRFKNYTTNQWAAPMGGAGGGGGGHARPGGAAAYQAPRANPFGGGGAGAGSVGGGSGGGYSGFAPGKKSGPEQGFRDGGGPDSMSEMAEDDLPI